MKKERPIENGKERMDPFPVRHVLKGYRGSAEREVFRQKNILLDHCRFDGPGESPVKECRKVIARHSAFHARYAFWENRDLLIQDCTFSRLDRAPLWYVRNAFLQNCRMASPKTLRECQDIRIEDCRLSGTESFWQVDGFSIDRFQFRSYYPFLECHHGKIAHLKMIGKYSFQHCSDIEITDSDLDTKDAFWHSHDIVVRNSHLKGEYIAWYAHDLTFVDCVIEGTQPFVCSERLTFENCTFLPGTDRAFERTTAKGTLVRLPESIYNPKDVDFKTEDSCPVDIDLPRRCRYQIRP